MSDRPKLIQALAVVPTTDASAEPNPDALRQMPHPLDGEMVVVTEAERKRSALRMVERAGLWYLKRKIAEREGWDK